MRTLVLLSCVLACCACGSPVPSTPYPTPVSIFLTYPPYLQPSADVFIACASQDPSLGLFLNPIQAARSSLPGPLIELSLGIGDMAGEHLYQVGSDELQIIVNSRNPIRSLSAERVGAIYSGQVTTWEPDSLGAIQLWSYPAENALKIAFEAAFSVAAIPAAPANIAPDPEAMLSAVAADEAAIGYLPASWLPEGETGPIARISITSSQDIDLGLPVIASVSEQPAGSLLALLSCAQNP